MNRFRICALLAGAVLLINSLVWVPAVAAAAPVAVDDSFVVQKSSVGNNLLVLANDTVATAAEITAITTPDHGGFVQIVGSGRRIGYSPLDGVTGTETFQYTVTDPVDGDATATVTIKINAPPVALDDPTSPPCSVDPVFYGGSFPIVEDYGQFVLGAGCGPSANDTDTDGSISTWAIDTFPTHGTLEWLPSAPGFVGYTPDADYSTAEGDWASDSFSYHVIDNDGASSNIATYRIWLAAINDSPTFSAGPLVVSSPENTAYAAAWATDPSPGPANESDQAVHYVITDNPGNDRSIFSSWPAIDDDGVLSFVPAAGRTGTVHLTVSAQDDGGLVDYGGNVGGDPPDDTSDSVSLTITITHVNSAPVAIDDSDTTNEGSAGVLTEVTANDTDADGDSLTVTGATDGTKGTTTIGLEGTSVLYRPTAGQTGIDTYDYTVSDGHGGTDVGTVTITIVPVEVAPVASDDVATLAEDDGATSIDVLANDTDADGDQLHVTAVSQGTKGGVAITGLGTGVAYTPDPNANGSDSFTYTISDGHGGTDSATVNVTISAVNDAPVATDDSLAVLEDAAATALDVRANDSDPDGDALTITGTTNGAKGSVVVTGAGTGLTYRPNANANGSDAFTYTISDGHGGTDSATVNVTISAVNDGPVATDDSLTVLEDAAATAVAVVQNDTDVEGDALTITGATNGAKGSVVVTGSGTGLTYRPNANANGSDSFTYTISDGHGGTDNATVHVTISAVNDNPNAVNDPGPATIYLRALPKAIPVLANDTSLPDAPETLRIIAVTQGSHGKVAITGGGTGLTYASTGTTLGLDVFTYTIGDGHGGTDRASVQVKVVADTTKPRASITSIAKSSVTGKPSSIRLTVKWTLTDTGSGLKSQLLQRRTDSGSWVTVTLTSVSTRQRSMVLARHHTYAFRLRGTDRYGNVGLFATRSVAT
ncbi:MAG TPA: Ig-like domain-containing protein [Candidatus Limnocylindrales bacterium]|nr:Ig-like domain-containing protein [Candidatus Limnocylindrales bacterium]